MKRSVIRKRRPAAARRSVPARRPRPLGVSLSRFTSAAAICGALVAGVGSAKATTYYWDADGSITSNNFTTGFGLGGSGIWNTSTPLWWDTTAEFAWPNAVAGDTAIFAGTAGVVQLGGNITAGGLTFNSAGYNITDGTAGSKLTLAGTASIFANVVGTNTVSSILDGTNGLTLTGTGLTSVIALTNPANTYTGTTTITSGTLNIAGDGSLGNAANGISFNGAALGGLTFAQSTTLGAGRLVTLGTGATATVTSALNANVNVLGQVTGAGNLTLVNTGVTSLLGTANDFSGMLWAQNGTVALGSLADAAGSGSIRLGNAATAGVVQWGSGVNAPLTLTNRAIELFGAGGGGTIDSSALAAANSVTVNSNLLVTTAGAKILTLTGSNIGSNLFAGSIGDSTAGATALTKAGASLWTLSNAANNFTGAVVNNLGVLRITNAGAFGSGTFAFGAGNTTIGLELRADGTTTFNRAMSSNSSTNSYIYVDHTIGSASGTSANQTTTIGTLLSGVTSTVGLFFLGEHGYNLNTGVFTFQGKAASTQALPFNNYLGAPGYGAAGFQNGVLTLAGLQTDNIASLAVNTTISGWGDMVLGPILNNATNTATPFNVNKATAGLLTFSGSNAGWVNGLFTLSGGTTRISSAPTGGATLSLGAALLELRNDTGTNFGFNVTNVSGTSTLLVDHTLGGTGANQIATIGTLLDTSSNTLNVVGDHGYGLTTGAVTLGAAATLTLGNYLGAPGYSATGYTPGVINMASVTNTTGGVAGTLALTGFGDYSTFGTGSVFNTGGGTMNITKGSLGVVTFTGNNAGWTAGTVTASTGVTRLLSGTALGTASLTLNGGLVELRNDANTTFQGIAATPVTSTVVAGHTLGATGISNKTVTLGSVTGTASTSINLVGDNGYGITTGAVAANNTFTLTLNNDLAAPGYFAGNYTPGVVNIGSLASGTAGTGTIVLGGFGDYANFTGGNIANAGGSTLNLTKSAIGILTFSGNNSGWTSGTLSASGGTTLIDATNTNAVGAANLTSATSGLLEIRSATGTSGATWTGKSLTVGNATLVVDPLVGAGTTGQAVNLGNVVGAGVTQFIDSNHGYNLVFNAASTAGNASPVLTNIGNGTITYLGGLTSTAATSTWTFAGSGDSVVSGNIVDGAGKSALTKNGIGTLTLSGAANTFTGGITLNVGVIRITAPLGAGAGAFNLNNTGSGAPNNNVTAIDFRNNSSLDLSTHNFGRMITQVFNVDNNGSGTNGTITVGGGMGFQDSAWSSLFTGANGYSLKIGSATPISMGIAAGGITYTVSNYIPSTGGVGNLEIANGVTFVNTGAAGTLIFSGTGDFLMSGALTYTAGGTADTITKSGLGTMTLTGNNAVSWNNAAAIYTVTNGILRAGTSANIGGATTTVNLNGGVLDLRNDVGQTLAETITVGAAATSFINVDRAIGGAGTGQTMTLGGLKIGAGFNVFATNTAANNYSLNTGTLTVNGAAAVFTNNLGGTGTATIPALTGANLAVTLSGSGTTNVTGPVTLGTGTLTKAGTGTVTLSGNTANTNGAVNVNGGTLALDYSGGAASNILQSAALALGNGTLSMKGLAAGASQTLGAVTFTSGNNGIFINPNGGTTTLTLGTLVGAASATAVAGSQLLITSPLNAVVTFNQDLQPVLSQGRNIVITDGTTYDWAKNTGVNTTTTALASASPLALTGAGDSLNSNLTGSAVLAATRATNSLKLDSGGTGNSLDLGAFTLTLTQGGLLFVGANDYTIGATGVGALKSATPTNSDFVINQYGAGKLIITAPILTGAGTTTLTVGGTGTVVLGNAVTANQNTYAGTTTVNGGMLQIVNATRLGSAATNALTVNGGTFDLNGNNLSIGNFNGAYAGTIDNTAAGAANFSIGGATGSGTFLGTIKNTGGALSITKTGTGTITLGDVNGMSNFTYTGDLTNSGGTTSIIAVTGIADTASTRIKLGTATPSDSPTFKYIGNSNLILGSRQFDLTGTSGGTIDGSGVNGLSGTQGMLVINSDLLLSGTGNKTLTLTGTSGIAAAAGGGSVSGLSGSGTVLTINTFAGQIGANNPNSIALGLAVTGASNWALTGANTFTGGLTMSGTGILRGTVGNGASGSFGGSGNTITWSGAGQLDLRSDTDQNFGNPIAWGNAALKINVDRAINGSGYNRVMTLGAITEGVTGQTLTVSNSLAAGAQNNGTNMIDAYGLRVAGLVLNAGTATTITSAIGGGSTAYFATPAAGSGVAGAFTIDGISTGASLGTHTLTIGAAGNATPVTIITGNITQASGTSLALTSTGNVLLTLSGQTAATNYSGGLTVNNALGTVRATTPFSLGAGTVSLTNGTLELRGDSSAVYGGNFTTAGAPVSWSGTNAVQLYIGESLNGTGGHANTFTLGALTLGTGATKALTIGGISGSSNNSGDSVTFGGVVLNGVTTAALTNTVTNNLLWPGVLNLGAITNTNVTVGTQTLTIGGSGVTTIGNAINSATANVLTGIAYAGTAATGLLDLTGATGTNTYTGGLTLTSGTARATLANNLGGGPVIFNGGTLELRSDTNAAASYSGVAFQNLLGGTLNVGQLPGGTGDNSYGLTYTLGSLTPTAAGKTLTINGIYGTSANNGDNVTISSVNFTVAANNTTTVTNNLLLPGMLNIGTVANTTGTGSATTSTLTIGGSGVSIIGDAVNGTGLTGITYAGAAATGILDTSRVTSANLYSGGLTLTSGTVRVTSQFGLGANTGVAATSNPVIFGGGTLELRTDGNVTYSNGIQMAGGSGTLNIGPLPGGTGINGATGSTISLGLFQANQTGRALTINGMGGTAADSFDNVTFANVDLKGLAALTVSSNLPFPSMVNLGNVSSTGAAAATVLTVGGSGLVSVGDITGSFTGLTYSGSGILDVRSTAATNYVGGLSVGGGIVRVSNQYGLGANTGVAATSNIVNLSSTATLELRSDTNVNYSNTILLGSTGSAIAVGQLPGGTGNNGGVNIAFGLGLLKTSATGKTLTVSGIGGTGANSGDSLTFANWDMNNLAATTLANNLNEPGIVALGNVFSTVPAATAGAAVSLTIAGLGFTTMGDLTNGTGGTSAGVVTLTYSGTGTLQMTGTAATNYTGGLNLTGAGTLRMIGANSFGASTNAVALTAGTLDVRGNISLNVPNPITINTNNVGINADQVTSGNFNKTLTFSGAATVLGATAKVLTLTSSSGYGMSFTNGFSDTITAWNITNNAVGPVNLGPISYTSTAGALTIGGSGMTTVGNITGTTAALALTYNGTGLLDLTGNAGATNPMSGLTLAGTGGIVKVASANNLGAAGDTVNFNITGATVQVRSNGAGNNGTLAFGNAITLTSAATGTHTIDVGNAGSNTGNTVAFGALSNGLAASTNILVVNGANGYGVRFTGLTLPNGAGASTTLVANVPLTITGAVTNAETGFAVGNFDTLLLDGAVGGTLSGAISDAATGTLALNGLTRITKQGLGTWTLGAANNSYLGLNTITSGILKLGANNALGSAGMGTTVTAASGLTATVDLAGFNQTFGLGVGAIAGIQTSALILGGGNTQSVAQVIDSVGTSTLTLAGASTTGDIQYVSTNNPLGGVISVPTLNLGNAARTFNVGDSTASAVDLTISSAIQSGANGTITKTGTGALLLSGALTLPSTATSFFNIGAGAGSLIVTNPVTSTTIQTWTNASFSNTLSGVLDLAGKLDMGSNALTVSGIGQTQLANTAVGAGANVLNGGINVTGGVIGGLNIATGAATGTVGSIGATALTGSSSLASATLALSGINPIIRLAPALGTSLAGGTTPGLLAKTFQSGGTYTSLGATNFMVPGNPLATFTGTYAYLANLPANGGTIANLPFNTASTQFPATTSLQATGLLNITTAGVYNFNTITDDGSQLTIDGNAINSTANTAGIIGAIYLTPGLHVFNERMNNNATNGNVSVRYQGPDTAGALIDIPASALFQANSAADLASTFNNNLTLAATTNASIDVAANTTINGSLTMIGTGAGTTLNALGSGNINNLTISGATTLTDNLAIVTSTANLTLGGAISGPTFGITKSGFGTLSLGGSNTFSGATSITVGTLRLTNANALQNSALSLTAGTALQLRGDATTTFTPAGTTVLGNLTIDVDQLTTGQTNQVLTLGGALSLPASTLTVTGNATATGYSLGLGAVTITGAVVFSPTTANVAIASVNSVAAQNITLGGTSAGNSVGAITTLTGTVTKSTASTWTLSGANTYTGVTTISLGTLNLTGSLGNTATTVSGGIFNVNGAAPNALTGTASLIVNNAAATVNLNSTVNYTGVTTISNGLVNVNPASGAGINGNTAIALSGGTLSLQKAQALNAGTLTITGTPTLTETAANAISGTTVLTENSATAVVNLNQANNYTGATTLTLGALNLTGAGAISGSAITLNGGTFSETVTNALSGTASFKVNNAAVNADLSFANNHTGGDTITAGTLSFASGGLGSGTINQSGGTLKWDTGNNQDISSQFATLTGTATFDTNNNTVVFGSPVSAAAIVKTGLGSLTLGTTTLTGNLTLNQGTLNITGPVTGSTAASLIAYGGTANPTVVNVNGNFTGFGTTGGNVAGSVAVYNQTGGTVTVTPLAASAGQFIAGVAGYGYFNLTGSALYKASTTAQRFTVTTGSSTGVAFIGGNSSLNFASGEHFLVAFNGTGALGEFTIADSAVVDHSNASANFDVFWVSNNEYGVLNMAGGTLNNTARQILFGGGSGNNQTGFANLAGGTVTATGFVGNTGAGTGDRSFVNFAGGTYKASVAQTLVGPDGTGNIITTTLFGAVDNSAIGGPTFAGGLTLDTNGLVVTSNRTIAGAASSFGVTQANLTIPGGAAGNAGYLGAPAVQFSTPAAGGVPAAGYALISGGLVTGVVITDPGTYASGEQPTITFTGGGGTIAPFVTSSLTTANLDAGVTVIGGGTLLLSAANSFGGTTSVIGGSTIKFAAGGALAGPLSLGSAGTIGTLDLNGSTASISNLLVGAGATAGSQIVTNTSATTLGTLALNVAGSAPLPAIQINDGGTQKTALALTGPGSMTQTNTFNYTGGTLIQNGSLRLAGADNRLIATSPVTLGNLGTSGKLILGGDAVGGTGAGTQRLQTLTQSSAASILASSGTGLFNSVTGGSAGGTSSGTPGNNSVLTLNIGSGFTDTYAGLFGWDGQGTVGFQNNLNVTKSGPGTLILSADLTNWTGTQDDSANPGNVDLVGDPTRPTLTIAGGVVRASGVLNTYIAQTGGVFDDQTVSHGPNFFLKVTGGLVALSQTGDTFANSGLTSASSGVAALNVSGNTALVDVAGSNMYLGAIGARLLSPSSLAAGLGSTYRFGGGAPWNALGSAAIGGSGGNLQIGSNVIAGANNVIIGDNGTYAAGLFGNLSSVEFLTSQSYSGTTSVLGGTLTFNNAANPLGTSAAANSILLDGGAANNGYNAILRWGAGATTDLSSRLGIVSGGTVDIGANNVTFATAFGNTGGGTGGLNKSGSGTLTLPKPETYAGPTTVTAGVLQLNGATGSLATSSALNFAGTGSFRYDNTGAAGALAQTMGPLSFSSGDGTILSQRTANFNTTLTFASLSARSAGATGNITVAGTGATTALNQVNFTSGPAAGRFLDGGLFVGGSDFAVADSTGYLRAISYGTDKDSTGTNTSISQATAAVIAAGGTNADVNVTGAITAQTSQTIESLKITGATAFSFLAGGGQFLTITSGGIIKTGASALLGSASTNGNIQAGATGTGELVVRQDTAADVLTINSNIQAGSLTKSGAGTLTLAGTNTITGPIAINTGALSMSAVAQYGATTGFVLNGGTFNWTGAVSVPKLFTVGLNGGTFLVTSAGNQSFGNVGDALGLTGAGARTVTFNSVADRKETYQFSIADNGGPTSVAISGAGDTSLTILNGSSTYTGPTTITRGILQLASAGALPGGLGGATVTPSNTGGGNLSFAAGANRAILELTDASGGFFRPVGTGLDQIQWTGNGGFSNASTTQNLPVNLGGAGATLVWGAPGFVPAASILEFGEAAGNANATGTFAIDFQNRLDLSGATHTVQVDNTNAVVEAIMSGALTNGSATAAVFTKTGVGALSLTGVNNAGTSGALTTTVSSGTLLLANTTTAVPGINGDTTSRSITVGPNAAVVLPGATDLTALFGRLNTASTGVVALDSNSSANLDFNTPGLSNLYLGAFSSPGGTPIYYSGTITPASNTYKFAQAAQASPGAAVGASGLAFNVLDLNGTNQLTNNGATPRSAIFGGNSTAQGGTGVIYVTGANTYSGGTIVGEATGAAGTSTAIGIGNDSAVGTGPVTMNDGRFAALNGDHTLSNNILSSGIGGNMSLAGDKSTDGAVNGGAMTYLGTVNLSSLTTGGVFSRSPSFPIIVLGDLKTSSANNLNMVVTSAIELLTTPAGAVAKSTSGPTNPKGFNYTSNPAGALIIDSASSLGAAPTANNLTFLNSSTGSTGETLEVLPGAGTLAPIVLSPNQGLNQGASGTLFYFTINGAPTLNDSTGAATAGLIGNSELVFPGVINGASANTATPFNKLGYGTLTLQGKNTVTYSATTTQLAVLAGTLKLDFANSIAGDPIFVNTMGMQLGTSGAPTASTLASPGVTVALLGKSGQSNTQLFGPVNNFAKDNAFVVNSNGGTLLTTLGVITNTLGGTLAVTLPAQGTVTTGVQTLGAGGLILDANANPFITVNGSDWGARNGTSLVAGSTVSGFYTPNGGTALTAASNADMTNSAAFPSGPVTTTVASLRFNAPSAVTLDLGGNNTLVTGGILLGNGTGGTSSVAGPTQTIANGTVEGTSGKNLTIYQANAFSNLTISAVIANNTAATGLSKAGPGTLVLSGANSYTGVTLFNGGIVSVNTVTAGGVAGPLGGAATNVATSLVFNGGSLQYTGATASTDRGATFNAVSAIDVTQSGTTLTLGSGAIGLAGQATTPGILRKIGAGALTLGGTGDNANLSVEITSGTLNLGKTSTSAVHAVSGNVSNAALIVDNLATAKITGSGGDQIFDGSSVLVKTGGTLDLNGATEAIDGLAGGGTVNSASGTPVLTVGAANDVAISAYTLAATSAGLANTGLNNFSGVISGTLALTKSGAGTQILGGSASTYTGATTISSGTLKMGAANALPSGAGKSNVTIVGNLLVTGLIVPGTLDLGGYDQAINGLNSTTGGVVVNTPTVLFTTAWSTPFGVGATTGTSTLSVGNGNAAGAFNGVLQDGFSVLPVAGAGAGTGVNGLLALNKVGTGTQTLSGLNTYSGGTIVSSGTLQLSGAGTLGSSAGGLTLAGGTLDLGGATPTVSAFSLTAAAASGNTLQNGSLTAPAYNISNAAGTATVTANLLGSAALTKSGAGILALTGTNNYSGGTTINGGTVQINSTSSLGALAGGVVINAATLQATADIATTRSFQLGTATSTIAVDATKTYSVSGAISDGSGTGTLNKSGLGTLVLTGTNLYSGGTNVAAGTLQVGTGGTAGTLGGGAITTGTNATLAINHSDPVTIGTAIGGAGNFAQLGSGTTIFTGANGYAGTTTISGGTLQVGNGGTAGALGAGAVTNNANLSFQRTDPVTVAAAIGGSGTVTQTGGVLNLNGAVTGQALHVASGQVNLGTGDTTAANPNHSLTALTIDAGTGVQVTAGAGVKLVQATSLTLAGTATLDLTNNAFVLNYAGSVEDPTKTAAVAALLQTGFNGGLWNGIGGIMTSQVASDMAANPTSYQYLTGIGYMPGALATGGSFLGRAVDAGSVVARYTYYGDANLDGVVNGLDYGLIDTGFAAQHNAGFVVSWVNGDFNYDGKIDGSDYALIDTAAAFTNGGPVVPEAPSSFAAAAAPSSVDAAPEAQLANAPVAQFGTLPTAVPEPASFGLLLLGGAMLGLRRRRAK